MEGLTSQLTDRQTDNLEKTIYTPNIMRGDIMKPNNFGKKMTMIKTITIKSF